MMNECKDCEKKDERISELEDEVNGLEDKVTENEEVIGELEEERDDYRETLKSIVDDVGDTLDTY